MNRGENCGKEHWRGGIALSLAGRHTPVVGISLTEGCEKESCHLQPMSIGEAGWASKSFASCSSADSRRSRRACATARLRRAALHAVTLSIRKGGHELIDRGCCHRPTAAKYPSAPSHHCPIPPTQHPRSDHSRVTTASQLTAQPPAPTGVACTNYSTPRKQQPTSTTRV